MTGEQRKPKPEVFPMRVDKGCFVAADTYTAHRLRQRGYHIGDIVFCSFKKPRNPKFNRLAHQIGQLVVANIDGFNGLDAHTAIKRLQMEGRIACDEIGIMIPGYGMVIQIIPRSLSFETQDEGEFHETVRAICRLISERYWKDLTPEKIEEMAEIMVQE